MNFDEGDMAPFRESNRAGSAMSRSALDLPPIASGSRTKRRMHDDAHRQAAHVPKSPTTTVLFDNKPTPNTVTYYVPQADDTSTARYPKPSHASDSLAMLPTPPGGSATMSDSQRSLCEAMSQRAEPVSLFSAGARDASTVTSVNTDSESTTSSKSYFTLSNAGSFEYL